MTHSLHTIEGKEEWVITTAPNNYIVGVKLSAEHAAAVGHDRIAISMQVLEEGAGIGINGVYTIGELPGNERGVEIEPEVHENGHYSDILVAVLSSQEVSERMRELTNEFVNDIGWDAINADYVQDLDPAGLHSLLKEVFGE